MPTYDKIHGAVLLASNTPGVATGYGTQAKLLVDRMVRHGMKVGVASNYGLEGRFSEMKTPHGPILHYPRGYKAYCDDVIPTWYEDFKDRFKDRTTALMTLYDVWVYKDMVFEDTIHAWTPMDHLTPPPRVLEVLRKDNVRPISMAPHGERQMTEYGIENTYIPHAIDSTIFKPTKSVMGRPTREFMNIPKDAFLIGIVASNKANGHVHRKAVFEQLAAAKLFMDDHPDAYLYLHMEASGVFGGFRLDVLLKSLGFSEKRVRIADPTALRTGYPDKIVAALYTSMDVLLNATYGEGFGLTTVEAQMCSTPVITSNWTASQDLVSEDSWKVEGQWFWNESQSAIWKIPSISHMVESLEEAYERKGTKSEKSREFALQFDVEKVWYDRWMPYLQEHFS